MLWHLSHRADRLSRMVADRHYSRQKIGTPQFVPPGRCLVLYAETETGCAYWVTSWPFAQYVKHAWGGAWICSAFRNEGASLSSTLIRQAVAASRWYWGQPPELGMVTFADPDKIRNGRSRGRQIGRCFILAGFKPCGETKLGLPAFQLLPQDMPEAAEPLERFTSESAFDLEAILA